MDESPEAVSDQPADIEPSTTRLAPALWPLALIVAAQFAAMIIPGRIAPGTPVQFNGMIFGGGGGALAILVWWLTRGRVSRTGRWVGLAALVVAAPVAAATLYHYSLQHPLPIILNVLPSLSLALVATLAIAQVTGWPRGGWIMLAGSLATLAAWGLVRVDGLRRFARADRGIAGSPGQQVEDRRFELPIDGSHLAAPAGI